MIRFEVSSALNLGRIAPAIQTKLRVFVADRTLSLRDAVKSAIARMFQSTGPLYQAVQAEMEESVGSVTGRVFIDGKVIPYANIQERGGKTKAHIIRPVRAMALAFLSPAKMGFSKGNQTSSLVIVKEVHHPGSRIPEHPYMRYPLAKERPIFASGIRAIVEEALQQ